MKIRVRIDYSRTIERSEVEEFEGEDIEDILDKAHEHGLKRLTTLKNDAFDLIHDECEVEPEDEEPDFEQMAGLADALADIQEINKQ